MKGSKDAWCLDEKYSVNPWMYDRQVWEGDTTVFSFWYFYLLGLTTHYWFPNDLKPKRDALFDINYWCNYQDSERRETKKHDFG